MQRTVSKHGRSAELDLPEGYTVRIESALEEETGQVLKVLVLMRADGGVAWVFSPSETAPTSETVSARAWDDLRSTGGHTL